MEPESLAIQNVRSAKPGHRPKMPAVIGTGAQGVVGRRLVMSRVLCRRERGADSLVADFMGENGEEVHFDGGSVADAGGVRRRTS